MTKVQAPPKQKSHCISKAKDPEEKVHLLISKLINLRMRQPKDAPTPCLQDEFDVFYCHGHHSWLEQEMRPDLPGHIILAFILPIHVYKSTGVHLLAPQSGNQLHFLSMHGPTGFLGRTPTHEEHGSW